MFNGWLSFAGNEILNEERTREYARHIVPNFQMPTRCIDDKGLAAMLDDPPYRTPLLDDAPWIDHDDPDTYGFCGALPLSVSGLTDNTRTGTVTENSGDGGSITGYRKAMKEVRVTALLMAESEASLAAGKRWLSAVLDGGCDPCAPADLCFLVGNAVDDRVSMGDYVIETLPSKALAGHPSYWQSGSGVFTPTSTSQDVATPEAPHPLPCDEIIWHWRITSATAGTTIVIETLGESGITNSLTATLAATGGTFSISDRGTSSRRSWSRLRVTSAPGETVTINSVDMEFRTDPPEDACFTKYARQLRRMKCIYGPVTIEEYEPTAGAMEKVEFAFSGAPFVYGLPTEVLSVIGKNIQKNVRTAEVFEITTVPACAVPKQAALIMDPDCPPVPLPPRAVSPVSSCAPDPDYLRSYALAIPDSLIPLWADAVPILSIGTASIAARKVQVRFMPRPFPGQAPGDLDPCSVCGEFVIDYIPPNSTFTIDGVDERAYITQKGNVVTDAGHLLSGMTSTTLFQWPVLTCGSGYFALVDIASTGVSRFDLSIAVRE